MLLSEQLVEEALAETEKAGPTETGGAVLGKIVRGERNLPGATTPIVTVLTAVVMDPRHVGDLARFSFDPTALQAARTVAERRGLGESVLTAFHSHGWNPDCGHCNSVDTCPLPQATFLSLDDYRVAESLFPSKSTVLPIAGRKVGAHESRPVLEVHAWAGGHMEPISWRSYRN